MTETKEQMKPNCKVKRIGNSCCGMIENNEYECFKRGTYFFCKLDDGKWTEHHWGGDEGTGWFEIIEKYEEHI